VMPPNMPVNMKNGLRQQTGQFLDMLGKGSSLYSPSTLPSHKRYEVMLLGAHYC